MRITLQTDRSRKIFCLYSKTTESNSLDTYEPHKSPITKVKHNVDNTKSSPLRSCGPFPSSSLIRTISVIFVFVLSSPLQLPPPSLHKIFTRQTKNALKLRLVSEMLDKITGITTVCQKVSLRDVKFVVFRTWH